MARQLAPMHPGEVLREEFLLPLGLSAGALANARGGSAHPHEKNRQ
jgi:plasmid maintenance system antidote protein VapI